MKPSPRVWNNLCMSLVPWNNFGWYMSWHGQLTYWTKGDPGFSWSGVPRENLVGIESLNESFGSGFILNLRCCRGRHDPRPSPCIRPCELLIPWGMILSYLFTIYVWAWFMEVAWWSFLPCFWITAVAEPTTIWSVHLHQKISTQKSQEH